MSQEAQTPQIKKSKRSISQLVAEQKEAQEKLAAVRAYEAYLKTNSTKLTKVIRDLLKE